MGSHQAVCVHSVGPLVTPETKKAILNHLAYSYYPMGIDRDDDAGVGQSQRQPPQ